MRIFQDFQALHQIPEQDWNLPKTLAYLHTRLGKRAFSPVDGALAAYFDFGRPAALAFRSDMDALPGGHLCGHDGHMAILLELARWLEGQRSLPYNVLLIFQPGEETTGGAAALCATGMLEAYAVAAIFGLHIWPGLPAGRIFTGAGPVMAGASQVDAVFSGKAGHIAQAGPDALAAAVEFAGRTRWQRPEGFCRYGLLQAGQAGNIRAGTARLQGSLRSFSGECLQQRKAFLLDTAREVGRSFRCQVSCNLSNGYLPVINPPELVSCARQAVDFGTFPEKSWMAEDFSAYQQRVPGLFFFLGAGDCPPLHSPDFEFPLQILPSGAQFWKALAAGFPRWEAHIPTPPA